jgi:hypothetical protein
MVRRLNSACGLHSMVTCMCCNGSKRMELLGTVISSPVLRKVGTIMLWNGLERMAVLNHKLDRMLLCTSVRLDIQSASVLGALLQSDNQYFYHWPHYDSTKDK